MSRRSYIAIAVVIGVGVGVMSAYYYGGSRDTIQKVYIMPKVDKNPGTPVHSVNNYIKKPGVKGSAPKQPGVFKPKSDTNCIVTIPEKYTSNGEEPFKIPNESELLSLPDNIVRCLYHRYVTTLQYFCGYKQRFGQIPRNGWYICSDPAFAPKNNCVVFSSNKKFTDNFFLSDIKARYRCRTFTTPLSQTNSLQGWITKTNTSNDIIDVLTLSVSTYPELEIIDKMVKERSIGRVKQLLLELHFDPAVMKKSDYVTLLKRLKMLFGAGLRIIWFDRLFQCASTNKYNRCYAVYFVQKSLADTTKKFKEMSLPSEDNIRRMNGSYISDLYYKYLMTTQFFCKQVVRIGRVVDGGWNVCHDMILKTDVNRCIVYSFGINHDFSFDDDMVRTYNCNVYSFDPTMKRENHKHSRKVWFYNRGIGGEYRKYGTGDIAPLNKIRKDLNHEKVPITVLKADTEGAEWPSTPQMLRTNQLSDVSQFYLELHSYGMVAAHLILLKQLHEAGFRLFWFHTNPSCVIRYKKRQRTGCMEVYFINTRYPFTI
ncbi:uncharacterized protein LOC133173523 [Saccostrea echinata]|uniref:uncharacterized protein LOC133173523 n=1 Tax=Saccostrea echinata TaxID=191078 RepID=UPI002A7FCF92|nr:uncharacterized protein LOC133173523 [Saccostrea echinata]